MDEGVTVGRWRLNRLLFADDLLLLASSERIPNMHLIDLQLGATYQKLNPATKRPRHCVSQETQANARQYTAAGR